jgi:hypothetical protein
MPFRGGVYERQHDQDVRRLHLADDGLSESHGPTLVALAPQSLRPVDAADVGHERVGVDSDHDRSRFAVLPQ